MILEGWGVLLHEAGAAVAFGKGKTNVRQTHNTIRCPKTIQQQKAAFGIKGNY